MGNLIQDEALALTSSAADGDDADGAFEELKSGDGLGIHAELPLLVAVDETEGLAGASGGGRRRERVLREGLVRR